MQEYPFSCSAARKTRVVLLPDYSGLIPAALVILP